MIKYFLTFLITFLLVFGSIVYSANEPEGISIRSYGNEYTIDFTLPKFEKKSIPINGKDYTQIIIPSYGVVSDTGLPALPLISFNLVIPYGSTIPNFQITTQTTGEEFLTNKVFPFQAPWPKDQPIDKRPFTINNNFYESSGKQYPFVKISDPFVISGVQGVMVTIYPFNYNPLTNKLTYVKKGSFRILTKGDVERHSTKSEAMNNFLGDVFVNYKATEIKAAMNYLIITAPEYQAALTAFVNHKIAGRYNVSVVNTTTTGTTTTAIKNYIQTLYNNTTTRPEFVLLVGDIDKIPAFTGSGAGTPNTDLNYALLEGTDYFADVFIGRFSVSNTVELQNVINKTIYMENYIGTLAKNNVFMASTDNYDITEATHNYVIDQYFNPEGYNNLKLYTHTYSATTAQLISALNSNKIFAIYSGHGGETSWADGPQLSQSQVRALTNSVFPYVYSFACVTGSYHISECFGETWIRTATGGSGFYGSSVNSYWDEDDILEKRLIKAMFDDDLTKITPMFDKAKIYFVNHYGTPVSGGTTLLRYLEMYNLMGDPSLATAKQLIPDSTAPTSITNLSAGTATSNSISLNWTAPYDTTFGGIFGYDIRYSPAPITNDDEFNAASQKIYEGQSDSAGTLKSYTLTGLASGSLYHFAIKAYDLWRNKSLISNPASGTTYGPPQISVTPDSMHKYLTPNTTVVDSVLIHNISGYNSTLDYSVEMKNNTFPGEITAKISMIPQFNNESLSDSKDQPHDYNGASLKGHGGPDLFGYKWIDSDEPNGPTYTWNDIVATGTLVNTWTATGTGNALDDGYAGPFPLGFNFKFYGVVKNQVYISTNGVLHFGAVTSNIYSNVQIPNSAIPNDIIAPFWDDLDGRTQGTVHYKQDGNKFIIQFSNWQKYSAAGSLTFQVVLYSSGKILIYYKNMVATLNSATVGIENALGNDGLQVAYNATYVKNNLALQFSAEPDWLSNNALSGTIHNGNSVKVTLTFNSDDYPLGDYSMDMVVKSNDPSDSVLTIPIMMTIKSPMQLNLTAFIEGFYNGTSMISDSVKIELRSSVSPYNLVESKAMILNSSGNGNCTFAAPTESTPYYLVLKHRNTIETWSALPQIFTSSSLSYDFSDSLSKAYGNNLNLKGTKCCLINGDCNQDGYIDGSDYVKIVNEWESTGTSMTGDTNGDQFIDGSDYVQVVNNWEVSAITPLTQLAKFLSRPLNRNIIRGN